ncbi:MULTISPECIES: thymidylate synthase [Nonlabens]|uniref:thymidylate synthase n=1 Tax=Nonlabens TaxID=363408 RepID=UPI000CF38BAA|nr:MULTISPECIES: thymidylate synthase [Nonlabens]PQJ19096.1 thymidylate synthase [Nonlabens tegetincola]
MTSTNYFKKYEYPNAELLCYDNYVIGKVHEGATVDTELAMRMLTDVNESYKDKKVIFISNRQFGYSVDPKVYKLVNPKKLIGIAIVGHTKEQKIQATIEQTLYSGSFGFFDSLDKAIAWAHSFFPELRNSSAG